MLLTSVTLTALVLLSELLMCRESLLVSGASPHHRPPATSSSSRFSEAHHPVRHHGGSPLDAVLHRLYSSAEWDTRDSIVHGDVDDNRIGGEVMKAPAVRQADRHFRESATEDESGRDESRSTTSYSGGVDDGYDEEDGVDSASDDADKFVELGDDDDDDRFGGDKDEDDHMVDDDIVDDDTADTKKEFGSRRGLEQELSDAPGPTYATFTEEKWARLGTRGALEETRRNNPNLDGTHKTMSAAALAHIKLMNTVAKCEVPRPKVVNVQDMYPDPSKRYTPHCILLHHCSDSTGCCRSDLQTCKPKNVHKVTLYFYTVTVGKRSKSSHRQHVTESLEFHNHTECECRPRDDEPHQHSHRHALMQEQSASSSLPSASNRRQRQAQPVPKPIQVLPYHKPGCRCPEPFSPRTLANGCTCDCFDRQADCLRFKKGKEYFSPTDKMCIQTHQCSVPECEFGAYMRVSGRCPRRHEKFSSHSRQYGRSPSLSGSGSPRYPFFNGK